MPSELQKVQALIEQISKSGDAEIQAVINNWRRSIVTMIAESQSLDILTVETLKLRLQYLADQVRQIMTGKISDYQRRVFIKGIQTVDKIIKEKSIFQALPYLSERKLESLYRYSAEQVKGLVGNALQNVTNELDLAVLGQKPVTEVLKAIGKNLDDPSVFGTIAKRAAVIYQTEVKRIQNLTTSDRLKQSIQQVPDLKKKWVHSHVGVPRPYHFMMDGTTIGVNEKFELRGADGNIYMVDAPHDAILPVGEVANCRCIVIPVVGRFEKDQTT
jgi:hypothetical protein